jgi:hypothetical protein
MTLSNFESVIRPLTKLSQWSFFYVKVVQKEEKYGIIKARKKPHKKRDLNA